MGRSRLPLPSFLGLFGALLMLFPGLLMGTSDDFTDVPLTDPGVQKALAFAMEQYNQDRDDSIHYFKHLCLLKAQLKVDNGVVREYYLMAQLVKTRCKKKAGKIRKYRRILECKLLPRNQEKPTCYFKVKPRSPPHEMNLATKICTRSEPPMVLSCSG